ncbi:MAG TPA: energy transducer TonB [Pyrinomonadaceae bacterium]|nr:energy transducer TonB [Pyrinomonadaceae bacterium]
MTKNISTFVFLFIFVFAVNSNAQNKEEPSWLRIESENKDFSIAVPPNYQVLADKKGFSYAKFDKTFQRVVGTVRLSDIRYITASQNGASFFVFSYKVNNLKDGLNYLSNYVDNGEVSNISFNQFKGKSSARSTDKFYYLHLALGSNDRIYHIFGGARDRNNETLQYFFSSLKLNGNNLFNLNTNMENRIKEPARLISSLEDTPFLVEVEEQKTANAQNQPDKKNPAEQKDSSETPLGVIFKPRPRYTEEARGKNTVGTVRLRISFSGDGSIGKISVVKGLENGLTEEAIKAARLIRFLPQEKDNTPISVSKLVEFGFSIY